MLLLDEGQTSVCLVCFVCLILWLNETNQMNKETTTRVSLDNNGIATLTEKDESFFW